MPGDCPGGMGGFGIDWYISAMHVCIIVCIINSCYLCRLIRPVVTTKTLLNIRLLFESPPSCLKVCIDVFSGASQCVTAFLHGGERRDFIDVDRVNFLCLNFKPKNLVIVKHFLFLPKKGGLNWN